MPVDDAGVRLQPESTTAFATMTAMIVVLKAAESTSRCSGRTRIGLRLGRRLRALLALAKRSEHGHGRHDHDGDDRGGDHAVRREQDAAPASAATVLVGAGSTTGRGSPPAISAAAAAPKQKVSAPITQSTT